MVVQVAQQLDAVAGQQLASSTTIACGPSARCSTSLAMIVNRSRRVRRPDSCWYSSAATERGVGRLGNDVHSTRNFRFDQLVNGVGLPEAGAAVDHRHRGPVDRVGDRTPRKKVVLGLKRRRVLQLEEVTRHYDARRALGGPLRVISRSVRAAV